MGETYTIVVGEKGQITVPVELRKKYGLAKGTVLLVEDKGKEFSLIPTIVIPQYEFDWEEEEKLAEKDLQAGKVKRYSGEGYVKELESRLTQKTTPENSDESDS